MLTKQKFCDLAPDGYEYSGYWDGFHVFIPAAIKVNMTMKTDTQDSMTWPASRKTWNLKSDAKG